MLDQINETIKELATETNENGEICVNQEVIDFLTPYAKVQGNYIEKLRNYGGLSGKNLLKSYKYWEKEEKFGSQSFGNFVEYYISKMEKKKAFDKWISMGVTDCNRCK